MFGVSRKCSRSLGGKRVTLCETSVVSAESSCRSFGLYRKAGKERGRGDRLLHIGCFRYTCFRPFRPFLGNLAISHSWARVRDYVWCFKFYMWPWRTWSLDHKTSHKGQFCENENQLYSPSVRKHTRNLLWFLRSSWYIHAYIHTYRTWKQKHLKRLNNK